jgi:hypothetical protein
MKRAIAALPLLVVALFGATGVQAANADTGTQSRPDTVSWRDEAGLEHRVRALTAAEARARGLDEHIDMSRYRVTAPAIADSAGGAQRTAPRREDGSRTAGTAATACWSHWYSHGTNLLYGRTDVSWCGDGQWVRYATNRCWGYANPAVPTYRYLRCQTDPQYGVGWNVYEVWSRWELCPGWQPLTGQCWVHDDPRQEWQYQGDGGVVKIG